MQAQEVMKNITKEEEKKKISMENNSRHATNCTIYRF